jgi:NhaP-type Na+/H+ or K+/H+ antiporter
VITIIGAENITDQETIANVVMITIFFSVLAHGVSAAPLSKWYVRRITQMQKDGFAQAETASVPEMSTRKVNLLVFRSYKRFRRWLTTSF